MTCNWRPRWKSRNSPCPSVPSAKRRRDSACARQNENSHKQHLQEMFDTAHPDSHLAHIHNKYDIIWHVYTCILTLLAYGSLWLLGIVAVQWVRCQTVKLSNFQWFPVVSSSVVGTKCSWRWENLGSLASCFSLPASNLQAAKEKAQRKESNLSHNLGKWWTMYWTY